MFFIQSGKKRYNFYQQKVISGYLGTAFSHFSSYTFYEKNDNCFLKIKNTYAALKIFPVLGGAYGFSEHGQDKLQLTR